MLAYLTASGAIEETSVGRRRQPARQLGLMALATCASSTHTREMCVLPSFSATQDVARHSGVM